MRHLSKVWLKNIMLPEMGYVSLEEEYPMSSARVRDRLLLFGIALMVCVFGVGSFLVADQYHIDDNWLISAWASFLIIPLFVRAFRGNLKRPFILPFLMALTVSHTLVCVGLMRWQVPLLFWLPIFILEFGLGAWAAHLFFGIVPSDDF